MAGGLLGALGPLLGGLAKGRAQSEERARLQKQAKLQSQLLQMQIEDALQARQAARGKDAARSKLAAILAQQQQPGTAGGAPGGFQMPQGGATLAVQNQGAAVPSAGSPKRGLSDMLTDPRMFDLLTKSGVSTEALLKMDEKRKGREQFMRGVSALGAPGARGGLGGTTRTTTIDDEGGIKVTIKPTRWETHRVKHSDQSESLMMLNPETGERVVLDGKITPAMMDQPMSSTDALRFMHPETGKPATPGQTPNQALASGYVVAGTAEKNLAMSQRAPNKILDEIEGLVNTLYSDEPGVYARGKKTFDLALDMLNQEDPEADRLHALINGALAQLIRAMGEKGNLNEGDVERAMSLLPRMFPLPDTRPVALAKIKQIRDILAAAEGKPPPDDGKDPEVIDLTK